MCEPMDSSFDSKIDGIQNQLPPQTAGGSVTQTVMTNQPSLSSVIDSTNISKPVATIATNNFTPLLRPGSMVMMTLTEEEYEMHYWPKLKTAIDQLLNMKPGAYIPISYEQMYSCVYKCVCKQFSERLYNDLLNHLSSHMEYLNSELKTHEGKTIPFIETFSFIMHQYLQALSGIVPIFNYMNRFYVENKLKTDLNEELRKLFRLKVVDVHINSLIAMLYEASLVPFAISPPTMASVMKNLYALNEEYSKLNPHLFSRYLPNILPPTDPTLLDQYAKEAHQIQEHIAGMHDFRSHESSRKRVFEDDISVT